MAPAVADDDPAVEDASLDALEQKLGYTFSDRSLLANALLHRSHIHVTGQERGSSNERLEFLGDAVLGLVVNEHLYRHFGDCSEGDLTKMKSLLVCGSCLSEVAGKHELGVHIRMSRSEAATGGRERTSILADTTEAIIGAVYLDGGLEAARGVIGRILLDGSDRVLAIRSEQQLQEPSAGTDPGRAQDAAALSGGGGRRAGPRSCLPRFGLLRRSGSGNR